MHAYHAGLQKQELENIPETANTGLWYDKYCNQWPEIDGQVKWSLKSYTENRKEINPKLNWIKTVTQNEIGDSSKLKEASDRQASLCETLHGRSQYFRTEWRFVTGLGQDHPVENGFAWHQTLGVPYLPGSSVKGMVRAWAEQWMDIENSEGDIINQIFGPRGQAKVGNIIFFDALPIDPVKLEVDIMTPHYAHWYADGEAPTDCHNPVPIPFLTVAADQTFQFAIAPRKPAAKGDIDTVLQWLHEALEWIGAGAKTAVGYGRFLSEESIKQKQQEEQISNAQLREGVYLKKNLRNGSFFIELGREKNIANATTLSQKEEIENSLSDLVRKQINQGKGVKVDALINDKELIKISRVY